MLWHEWNLSEWNNALVDAVFFTSKKSGTILSRIDASSRFLAKITNDSSCNPEDARIKFVNAFGDTTGLIRWHYRWPGPNKLPPKPDVYPACFAPLYLTLLAATADNETAGTGDFRQRFSDIIKLVEPHTIDFAPLPKMWAHVRQWSQLRFESHRDCSILQVPQAPSHERLIGISKRIAFPTYKDELLLRRILKNNNLSGDSQFLEIIKVIIPQVKNFTSSSFQEEFREFLKNCQSSNYKHAYESPFWGAVKDISIEQENELTKIKGINNLTIDISDLNDPQLYWFIDETLKNKNIIPSRLLPIKRRDDCQYVAYKGEDYLKIDEIENLIRIHSNEIGNRIVKQIKNDWIFFFPDQYGDLSNEGSYYNEGQVVILVKKSADNEIEEELKKVKIKFTKLINHSNYKHWDFYFFNNINEVQLVQILNIAPQIIKKLSKLGWAPNRVTISNGARFGQYFLLNPASNPQVQMEGAIKGNYRIFDINNKIIKEGELIRLIDEKFYIPPINLIDDLKEADSCEYILCNMENISNSISIKLTTYYIDIENFNKFNSRIWLEDSDEGTLNSEDKSLDSFEILNNIKNKNVTWPDFNKSSELQLSLIYKNKIFNNIDKFYQWIWDALLLRFQKRNIISYEILKEHVQGVSEVTGVSRHTISKALFYGQNIIPIINKDGPYNAIRKGNLFTSVIKREGVFYLRIIGLLSKYKIAELNNYLNEDEIPTIFYTENFLTNSCIEIKVKNQNRAEQIVKYISSTPKEEQDDLDPFSAFNNSNSKIQKFSNAPLNNNLQSWNYKEWKWNENQGNIDKWSYGEIRRTTGKTRAFFWTKLRNDLYIKTDSLKWSWLFSSLIINKSTVSFSTTGEIYWSNSIPELPSSLTRWWMLHGGGCIVIMQDGTTVFTGPHNKSLFANMKWLKVVDDKFREQKIGIKRLKLAKKIKVEKAKFLQRLIND